MSVQADIEADLPPIQHTTKVIPPDRVASLFSSPFELVAAQANKIILPTHLHVRKHAGGAWTSTGSGVLRIATIPANTNHWAIFDQSSTTTFFNAAEAVWVGEAGKGQFWGLGDVTGGNLVNGVAVGIGLASADMTGSGGHLTVNLWYRVWPGI